MKLFEVLHAFKAEEDVELSVCKGEHVASDGCGEKEGGWIMVCRVKHPSEKGFVPISYLQEVERRNTREENDEDDPSSFPSVHPSIEFSKPYSRSPDSDNTWTKKNTLAENGSDSVGDNRMPKDVFLSATKVRRSSFPRQASAGASKVPFSGRRAASMERPMIQSSASSSFIKEKRQGMDLLDRSPFSATYSFSNCDIGAPIPIEGVPFQDGAPYLTLFADERSSSLPLSSNEIELEKLKRQHEQSNVYILERMNEILSGVENCRTKTMVVGQTLEELVGVMQDDHLNWKRKIDDEKNRLLKLFPA